MVPRFSMIDAVEQQQQNGQHAPDGLNVLAQLINRIAALETNQSTILARLTQAEQSLDNITISADAVNVLNVSALRTLEQVLHAALSPQPVAETTQEEPDAQST